MHVHTGRSQPMTELTIQQQTTHDQPTWPNMSEAHGHSPVASPVTRGTADPDADKKGAEVRSDQARHRTTRTCQLSAQSQLCSRRRPLLSQILLLAMHGKDRRRLSQQHQLNQQLRTLPKSLRRCSKNNHRSCEDWSTKFSLASWHLRDLHHLPALATLKHQLQA